MKNILTFCILFILIQAFLSTTNDITINSKIDEAVVTTKASAVCDNSREETGNNRPVSDTLLSFVKKLTPIEILIWEEAEKAGVSPSTAIRIAKCESSLNPTAKHKISSASGLYMFIDKTWANYCVGDRMNAEDNLRCFLKLYPKFPHYWECK